VRRSAAMPLLQSPDSPSYEIQTSSLYPTKKGHTLIQLLPSPPIPPRRSSGAAPPCRLGAPPEPCTSLPILRYTPYWGAGSPLPHAPKTLVGGCAPLPLGRSPGALHLPSNTPLHSVLGCRLPSPPRKHCLSAQASLRSAFGLRHTILSIHLLNTQRYALFLKSQEHCLSAQASLRSAFGLRHTILSIHLLNRWTRLDSWYAKHTCNSGVIMPQKKIFLLSPIVVQEFLLSLHKVIK